MTISAKSNNKIIAWILLFVIFVAIIACIGWYFRQEQLYPSTDDGYIQAHIVNMAPQINGIVTTINVKDHQRVKKGDLLLTIEARPYQYALEKAQAQLKLAQEEATRIFPLIEQQRAAPAEGDKINEEIQEALSAVSQAQFELQNTTITAPTDGIIANFTTRIGDNVSAGINLFSLIEQNHFWIDANFKETQLKRIKPFQKAKIKVDMYPGITFDGIVQSISPATGTVFALLPAENATGNWVKVTQRVPVKIDIVHPNPKYPLLAGTSVITTIDTVSNER